MSVRLSLGDFGEVARPLTAAQLKGDRYLIMFKEGINDAPLNPSTPIEVCVEPGDEPLPVYFPMGGFQTTFDVDACPPLLPSESKMFWQQISDGKSPWDLQLRLNWLPAAEEAPGLYVKKLVVHLPLELTPTLLAYAIWKAEDVKKTDTNRLDDI